MFSATVASICLMFTLNGCAATCPKQVFTAMTGEFTSPGYPDSLYPINQRCRYTINAGAEFLIEITFNDFELQPSSNGRRTDFVKLIDGFTRYPSRVVYYDGTMETPFTFVSKQRRVVIVFSTTRRINKRGFHATYRMFKEPKYCGWPVVKNGFVMYCIKAGGEPEFFSSCNITCNYPFQLDGNVTSQCNTDVGNWTELPNCALRPEILEICRKDITNVDCIFVLDFITEYCRVEGSTEQPDEKLTSLIDELGDELSEFEEDELPLIGKTQETSVKCPKSLCRYNQAAMEFVYQCPTLANVVQKQRRLNAIQKKNWIFHCFRCQNSGCKGAVLLNQDILKLLNTTHLPPPTTTTTPSPPPTSPLLLCDNLDDLIIEYCLENIVRCPWSIYHLAEMIERSSNITENIEYDGQSVPVGPVLDPNEVDEEGHHHTTETPETQTTGGGQPSENQQFFRPPVVHSQAPCGIHKKCHPVCKRNWRTWKYTINCVSYLTDTSFKFQKQRCAATCPAQVFTAKTGEFTSPGYPDSLYPNNQRCRYTIKAGAEFIIEITFNDFELQPSSNGRRTDFVKLIDGFARNPSQVVYYDGTMETPFTFVSKQRRVVIIFATTRRINKRGFHATYRLFKAPKYCDYPSLKYGWGECIEAGDEEFFSSCNITCDFGFQLDGNMTSQCNTDVGIWTELPNCDVSPEILEICTKDIRNVDCIYAPDVIAEYYRGDGSTEQTDEQLAALINELGDELSEFEEDEIPLIGKTQGTSVKCKKFLCLYNKAAGAFVYHCPKLANAVQKKRRLNATKKQNWINFCFQCQNSGCSRGGSGL